MEHSRPDWCFPPGEHPQSDDGYFENMSRTVFQAGLNWQMINQKWPAFRKAFADFDIDQVAGFSPQDVDRLLQDRSIIRNERKIMSTLSNALEFLSIREEFGSFAEYMESLVQGSTYEAVMRILQRRFHHLGPSSARFFLYSVGQPVGYA